MTDPDNTSPETLMRAAEIGKKAGLRYIYAATCPVRWVGDLENTRCPDCPELLIERYGYFITHYCLTPEGHCPRCSKLIPGCWDPAFGGQITSHPFVPRLRVSSNLMLVAQVTAEGVTLLTLDPMVAKYPGPIREV